MYGPSRTDITSVRNRRPLRRGRAKLGVNTFKLIGFQHTQRMLTKHSHSVSTAWEERCRWAVEDRDALGRKSLRRQGRCLDEGYPAAERLPMRDR